MRLVGYNLLTTVALLLLVELGLRLLRLPTPLPPPRVEFGHPNPTAMSHLQADPDLLWVRPGYAERIAAAEKMHPQIVFMGDSCTAWGRYDEDLLSIIEARSGTPFTFVNVGVDGWSSWSGLQQLQRDVLPMRPKAITIYFGWNDHWINFGLEDKRAARFVAPEDRPRGLFSELRIAKLVDKALLTATDSFTQQSPLRVSLGDFRANLRRMVRIARDHGIVPILLTAPTSHRAGREPPYLAERWLTNLEDLVPLHQRYVEAVRDVARSEEAPLVDLHREFNQLPEEELRRLFTNDGIHLSRAGDRRVAESIYQHLVEADLYWRVVGGDARSRLLAEQRFEEVVEDARLLASNRFDVWLDGNRLLYAKEGGCDDSEESFFLHVVPKHPADLPEGRKQFGYENLDFDLSSSWRGVGYRLGLGHRCVAARQLPPWAVASVRTGQFQIVDGVIDNLWEERIHFGAGNDGGR